ncbi:aminotransferase class V-fold PLP-dependent enzyme [Spongiibacter sp. KMU-166]|uniref:Aminotransferase class V-fold PLP-dependent enzyme n=1 Tax=Spongiibacter thalassae TaxID=2721624 RepID=A0ABX1GK63_9GAMM|nr:aminotransferase class V-fold PLP-dependent enzyme [Spongiibacter thalassae]NKI19624.1 aminotransferase class V-fold PLP-dependent enzyme [Spongiibacter thalassae]
MNPILPISNINLNREFELDRDIVYLNHAADAPWSIRAKNNAVAFAEEASRFGATYYDRWKEAEALLRRQFSQLINASTTNEIAILKNTSEGLSTVAYGLDWQPGDNVVIPNESFPSNRIVWESLASRGVATHKVSLRNSDVEPELSILNAIDQRTRLLSVSSVQNNTGLKLNLNVLGEFCRQHSVLFCVDAIQSLGAQPFDVQAIHADFVTADSHKWMLGPEGVALFFCREELLDQLRLNRYGWRMVEEPRNFESENWCVAHSARRFECGSLNMQGIHTLTGSLSLLLEYSITKVAADLDRNILYLIAGLQKIPRIRITSNTSASRRAGIVCFTAEGVESLRLGQELNNRNIICSTLNDNIRFSPHFYTSTESIDIALAALRQAICESVSN